MVNSKADEFEGKTAMELWQYRRRRRRFERKKGKVKKTQKKTQMKTDEDDEIERKRLRYKRSNI